MTGRTGVIELDREATAATGRIGVIEPDRDATAATGGRGVIEPGRHATAAIDGTTLIAGTGVIGPQQGGPRARSETDGAAPAPGEDKAV